MVISLSLNKTAPNILNDVLKIYGLVGNLKKKRDKNDDDDETKKKKTQQMSTVKGENSLCQPCGKTQVLNLPVDEQEVCWWPLHTSFFLTHFSSADMRPQPGAGVH